MVVAAVAGVVLWRNDEQAYWAVIGGVVNGVASKLLKKAFNEQRPLTAHGLKHDPGMPSTHAQSFAFFSLYASLTCMYVHYLSDFRQIPESPSNLKMNLLSLGFIGLSVYGFMGLGVYRSRVPNRNFVYMWLFTKKQCIICILAPQ